MNFIKNYGTSFFESQKNASVRSAQLVLEALSPILSDVKSVIDVGCGAGGWLASLAALKPELDIQGVDHPDVPRNVMFIDADKFHGADLTEPLAINRRYDLTLSLEVAEHLDPRSADGFMDNLTRFSDLILFSAATPRQGGTHHVNERWPDYWIEKFASRGFCLHDVVRPLIWSLDEVRGWYKQNCMIFAKPEHAARFEGFEDWGGRAMVHPDVWTKKTEPWPQAVKRVLSGRGPLPG